MQATAVTAKQLAGSLGVLWGRLMRADQGGMFRLVDELDLAMTQVKCLFVLGNCAEELSVKDLADRLGLSLPAGSRTVEGLLRRGLVERREDEHDRRIKRVRLTAEGRSTMERIGQARLHGLEAFAASLTPAQRSALHDVLTDIHSTPGS